METSFTKVRPLAEGIVRAWRTRNSRRHRVQRQACQLYDVGLLRSRQQGRFRVQIMLSRPAKSLKLQVSRAIHQWFLVTKPKNGA